MINGIMGYHDTDEQAAVTGEVESTAKPKGYKHPDLRMMMIWDMPGAGTLNHPRESYFEDKFLMCFDTLIIVTAERYSNRMGALSIPQCLWFTDHLSIDSRKST